jgi:hypothetical protein
MWKFQKNESDLWDGWNDGDIRTFTHNRFKSLTREILQNSLDARRDASSPVVVEFESYKLPAECIPGIDELRNRLQQCHDTAVDREGKDHIAEISDAIESLAGSEVSVLAIHDSNTNGMEGPCRPGAPFFRYLKAKGESGGDQTRGGSHGIGKAAPLACTKCRTLFVSTRWLADDGESSLIQGRARFRSTQDGDSIFSGTGFWGTENYQPLEHVTEDQFQWLNRSSIGTSIFIVGFSGEKNWLYQVMGYAASDFFAAIRRDMLQVRVKHGSAAHDVDRQSLPEIFDNFTVRRALEHAEDGGEDYLINASYFYRCLEGDGEVASTIESIDKPPGDTSVSILKEEGAPRKILLLRRGMAITSAIPKLTKISPRYADFACLLEVHSEAGNDVIRSMEPPAHDALSKQNMPENSQSMGEKLLVNLSKAVKQRFDDLLVSDVEEEGEVDFLKEFLADDTGEAGEADPLMEIDPNGEFVINPKPLSAFVPSGTADGDQDVTDQEEAEDGTEGGAGTGGGGGGGGGGGSGDGDGRGGTGKKKKKRKKGLSIQHQRAVTQEDGAKLFVRALVKGPVALEVIEVGADRFETLPVQTSSIGKVKNGLIELTPADFANNRCELDATFGRELAGGLRVRLMKLSKGDGNAV